MGLPARRRAAVSPHPRGGRCGHEHLVEFYETDGFLVDTVSGFVGPALDRGDAAVVVATAAHRAAFDAALAASGVDLSAAVAAGRYLALDAADLLASFMVGGAPDAERFRDAIGRVIASVTVEGRCVRVYGEMVALLWDAGDKASVLALEKLWNDLAATYEFELLCAYPMGAFEDGASSAAFGQICSQHTSVIPSEGYSLLEGSDAQDREVARLQQETVALRADIGRLRAQMSVPVEHGTFDAMPTAPRHDHVASGASCPSQAEADRRTSNRDQAAADRDRAAADRDQTASGRDQSQAEDDQLISHRRLAAADREQAAADRDQTASDRDQSQAEADQRTSHRAHAAADREQAAADRDQSQAEAGRNAPHRALALAAVDRWHAASDRDQTASDRDQSQASADQRTSNRDHAAADREQAAADSDQTASDRDQSRAIADQRTSNRDQAAADRQQAAADREDAAADREAATHDREQARAELRHAQHDHLTGAFGRELGLVALEQEINRARHGDGRLVLAYVDVDGLKEVNDRHGHAAGDEMLRDVVGAIHKHLRSYDPVVRVGGDEFVCALAGSTPDEARSRFREMGATLEQSHLAGSISVGFAALRPEDTLAQLTERGDAALYDAKHAR